MSAEPDFQVIGENPFGQSVFKIFKIFGNYLKTHLLHD